MRDIFASKKKLGNAFSGAAKWLDFVMSHAQAQGHRCRLSQAHNRDMTSDMQLYIGDWPEGDPKEKFLDLNDSFGSLVDFPKLGASLKVRLQVRISADRLESEEAKAKYRYLPRINGLRAVYFQYGHPSTVMSMLYQANTTAQKLTEDGWRMVALVVDVRFDPRWAIKKKGKP